MEEFEKDPYLLFEGEELPSEALQFILEKKMSIFTERNK